MGKEIFTIVHWKVLFIKTSDYSNMLQYKYGVEIQSFQETDNIFKNTKTLCLLCKVKQKAGCWLLETE